MFSASVSAPTYCSQCDFNFTDSFVSHIQTCHRSFVKILIKAPAKYFTQYSQVFAFREYLWVIIYTAPMQSYIRYLFETRFIVIWVLSHQGLNRDEDRRDTLSWTPCWTCPCPTTHNDYIMQQCTVDYIQDVTKTVSYYDLQKI